MRARVHHASERGRAALRPLLLFGFAEAQGLMDLSVGGGACPNKCQGVQALLLLAAKLPSNQPGTDSGPCAGPGLQTTLGSPT